MQTPNPAPDGDTQKKDWKQQATQEMQLLQKRILQLAQMATPAQAWSPTGSSVQTSSNEAGQRAGLGAQQQQSHSHSTLTSSSSSRGNKKFKGTPKEYDNSWFQDQHQIRKVKRCRDALWRGRAGLQSVETILEVPITDGNELVPTLSSTKGARDTTPAATTLTDSALSDAAAEPKTQLHGNSHMQAEKSVPSSTNPLDLRPLMSGIAEEMANAYGSPQEVVEVMNMYQQEIDETRTAHLDSLLHSFFPEKRTASSKNRRLSKSKRNKSTVNADEDVAEDLKPAEEVIASMQKLMKKQRELVEERSSFLMLPTRG
jgi:hypothetical protein